MSDEVKKKIINICIVVIVLVISIVIIISIFNLKKEEKIALEEDILNYLNETYKSDSVSSKSPIYGLLNYNFDNLNSISTDELIYANFMSFSIMNDTGIDSIYMGEYNMSKKSYLNSSKYVENPNLNCYYYQNILNQSGFNCDSVCSGSESSIMKNISSKLGFINVLPSDAKTYCIKNALFPIDSIGYFVNLTDVKNLYKDITNIDLVFDSKITNNKYYKYDAYLESELLRLDDNINKVIEVSNLVKTGELYNINYKAITDSGIELSGLLTLKKNNDKYYLMSNEINTSYNLN